MKVENAPSREDFANLIATMSKAQLELLYRVAQAILDYPATKPAGEPTAEELAEDAKWDEAFAKTTPEQWAKLTEKLEVGEALPMFDENGRWLLDDYTDEDFEQAKAGKGE
jgi:hypothetical protein